MCWISLQEHVLQVLHCAATQKYNTVAHKVCDAAEKVKVQTQIPKLHTLERQKHFT